LASEIGRVNEHLMAHLHVGLILHVFKKQKSLFLWAG